MKYGLLFLILGSLAGWIAYSEGGFLVSLYWGTVSCWIVSAAYLFRRTQWFGKRSDGSMNGIVVVLLLPYLLVLWTVWHGLRKFQREDAVNRLDEQFLIGRRLLAIEMPKGVQNVIDLTCEFGAPKSVVDEYRYHSFPILDASAPTTTQLRAIVEKIESLKGMTLIHCAQGHGRTGLVTAALLIYRDPTLSVELVVEQLQRVRPALRCNKEQLRVLSQFQMECS